MIFDFFSKIKPSKGGSGLNHCTLAKGFTIKEKLFAQISFFSMIITGTIGIIVASPIFVVPYILIAWYGIPGIIQRHIVCPRCPHLYQYGDCLQLPVRLTRFLVKERKYSKFSRWEKIVFLFIFFSLLVYPLYWLLENRVLLALFIFFSACWYGGQLAYFCKRCRVHDCPLNQAKAGLKTIEA